MNLDQPNFFAILPATVRYDSDLSDFAKIMFSEITALSNREGYCWATNLYFAKVFTKHELTISRIIGELKKKNYIRLDMDKKTATGTERHIYPLCNFVKGGVSENDNRGISKKVKGGVSENANHNNTSINNKDLIEKKEREKALALLNSNLEILQKKFAALESENFALQAEKEKEKNCEKKEKGTHEFPVPSSRKAVVKVPPHVIDKQNESQSEMKPYEFLTASYKYPSNWSDLLIEKFLTFCQDRYDKTERKFGANNAKEVISSINTLLLTNSCEIVEFSVSKAIQAGWSSIYLKEDNKKHEQTNNQPTSKGRYQDFADNYKA